MTPTVLEVPHRHHAVQQPGLRLGRGLQALHGPLVHHSGYPGVVYVEEPEACHVDATVTVRLQIQGKKVLQGTDETDTKMSEVDTQLLYKQSVYSI